MRRQTFLSARDKEDEGNREEKGSGVFSGDARVETRLGGATPDLTDISKGDESHRC